MNDMYPLYWTPSKGGIIMRYTYEYKRIEAVDGYINYYNNERIQEKTKWMPPTKFREASMCT